MTDSEKMRTLIRGMIQHEDSLRDQRLGWTFALNGFLFAALGLAWKNSQPLVYIVAVVGLFVAASSFATLSVSDLAIKRLKRSVDRSEETTGAQSSADASPIVGLSSSDLEDEVASLRKQWSQKGQSMGDGGEKRSVLVRSIPFLYMWFVTPIILAVAWVAVLIVRPLS